LALFFAKLNKWLFFRGSSDDAKMAAAHSRNRIGCGNHPGDRMARPTHPATSRYGHALCPPKEAAVTDVDAAVVGSGAGGLAAALKMAREGLSVLLLEAMPAFGGYLNSFQRDGFHFDTGLHYLGELGENGACRGLLAELGLDDRPTFVELNPEGFDRYVFPDFELRLGRGQDRLARRLTDLFPAAASDIARYFKIYDRIAAVSDAGRLVHGNWLSVIGFLLRHPCLLRYGPMTYQKLLDGTTGDRRLQAALSAFCGNLGVAPANASAVMTVMMLKHFLNGAYYPRGGSRALRDAFIDGLVGQGVALKNRSPVVSIAKRGKDFVLQTRAGDRYSARAVVSNVDPVTTLGRLTDPALVSSRIRRKIARLQPSKGAFYAFIGTDLALGALGLSDANIIHFDHYGVNRIFHDMTRPDRSEPNGPRRFPYFFITSPSLKDPLGGHAPSGYHTLEIITGVAYDLFEPWADRPSGRRGRQYDDLKVRIGHRLIQAAECYVPGLSQHLESVTFATPLTNEYWVGARRGGNFGPEQTAAQVGPGRFAHCTAGVEGLYLAGAGTFGGGVMSCAASGLVAALKVIDYLGRRTPRSFSVFH
jgi:all-trans-retinol 13,14-reductase